MTFIEQLKSMRVQLNAFISFAPREILTNFVLTIIQGMTAGVGILLLIPLLHLTGILATDADGAGSVAFIKDTLQNHAITLSINKVLLLYILIISLIALLNYVAVVNISRIHQRYIHYLRNKLYKALLGSNWLFITQNKMSDYANVLSIQVQIVGVAGQQFLQLFSRLILLGIYIGISLLLSWKLSFIAMICAIFIFWFVHHFNEEAYSSGQKNRQSYKIFFKLLTEQLQSLKIIKSTAREDKYYDELMEASDQLGQQNLNITQINEITDLIHVIGATLVFCALFYTSIRWLHLPIENLILLLVIFSRLMPSVTFIQKTFQQLLNKIEAYREIDQLLLTCGENQEHLCKDNNDDLEVTHKICLENVSFSYDHDGQKILDKINIAIEYNKTVAVTGSSGSGKTTLVDLIAGLLSPTSGGIYCDKTKLDNNNRIAWRRNLAYVTQETYLFHDTIRANLSWVCDDVCDEKIWSALELSAATDFVKNAPYGLDTVIGDRGIKLSGGERQRLALARALLSNPRLLILDEATSALDSENETKIQQVLKNLKGKMTIIIIAHRQSTIKDVDAIIDMSDLQNGLSQ